MVTSEHLTLLSEFLGLVGIPAEIQILSETEYQILITHDAFLRRRGYVEAWFTTVGQDDKFIILKERLRGTGTTNI